MSGTSTFVDRQVSLTIVQLLAEEVGAGPSTIDLRSERMDVEELRSAVGLAVGVAESDMMLVGVVAVTMSKGDGRVVSHQERLLSQCRGTASRRRRLLFGRFGHFC